MSKFLKFNVPIDICYPVGNDPKGIHRYCLCATQKIVKRFRLSKSREMFLVVRGSSGTILAGGMLFIILIFHVKYLYLEKVKHILVVYLIIMFMVIVLL